MHIGVDDGLGLIHSITTTAANEHDITQADQLLHGDEKRVWTDAGYVGVEAVEKPEKKVKSADQHRCSSQYAKFYSLRSQSIRNGGG